MNLDQTVTIQNFEQQLQSLLNKLHAEIDFTSKSLDINKQDFIKSFTTSLTQLDSLLQQLKTILQQISNQHDKHVQNLATLTLLPEKVAGNITELVPKIAKSLGNIYQPHIIETKNQFTILKQELEQGINNFHNKMLELSSQTMQESILISTNNRNKFVKTIAIMVIFSAVVAVLLVIL